MLPHQQTGHPSSLALALDPAAAEPAGNITCMRAQRPAPGPAPTCGSNRWGRNACVQRARRGRGKRAHAHSRPRAQALRGRAGGRGGGGSARTHIHTHAHRHSLRGLVPTWHDALLALLAAGRVLLRVAVGAEQLVLLGSERLVHKGPPAPRAVETGLVPVPVLVGQVLQAQSTRDVRRERGRGRGLCWTHSEGGKWATRGWNELGRTLLLLFLGPLCRQGCVRGMRLKNEWLSLGDCKNEKRHMKLISASPGHTDPGSPLAARTLGKPNCAG